MKGSQRFDWWILVRSPAVCNHLLWNGLDLRLLSAGQPLGEWAELELRGRWCRTEAQNSIAQFVALTWSSRPHREVGP